MYDFVFLDFNMSRLLIAHSPQNQSSEKGSKQQTDQECL